MSSYNWIEKFKEINKLTSDYQAAKKLGISLQAISNYKHKKPMKDEIAIEIAESLNIEASEILVSIQAEKSKNPEVKKAWERLSKMTKQSGKATTKLLIIIPFLSYLIAMIVYYVKLSKKKQYA